MGARKELSIPTQKKHDRFIFKTLNLLHGVAPNVLGQFLRKRGFSTPQLRLQPYEKSIRDLAISYPVQIDKSKKLQVYEWGNGPVILLVHGWGGRGLQMSSFVAPLVQAGFRVVTFDSKGHGESSTTYSSYLEFIQSLRAVIASMDVSVHGIVGHSMGASVALKVLEDLEEPVRFVSIAPMPKIGDFLQKLQTQRGIPQPVFEKLIKLVEDDSGLSLQQHAENDIEKLKGHRILLIHDQRDRINPFQRSLELMNHGLEAELMVTQGLGHRRILHNEDVLRSSVKFFL